MKNILFFITGVIIGIVGSYKLTCYVQELRTAEEEALNSYKNVDYECPNKLDEKFEHKENNGSNSDEC